MALLHNAVLRPSKQELIAAWAPGQPWFVGDAGAEVESVGSFRFDDPDGEVGVETLLVRFGTGPLLQVALTYRSAPLAGSEGLLVGTMSHSVLGDRWIYDGTGDPVYVAMVAAVALTGGHQADQFMQGDGELIPIAPTTTVLGSGAPGTPVPSLSPPNKTSPNKTAPIETEHNAGTTVTTAGALRVTVLRVVDASVPIAATTDAATLSGTWAEQPVPQLLATVEVLPS
jgi:hypothetical protein